MIKLIGLITKWLKKHSVSKPKIKDFLFHNRQNIIWELEKKNKFVEYTDERQTGKTYYGVVSCIMRCMANKNYRCVNIQLNQQCVSLMLKKARQLIKEQNIMPWVEDINSNEIIFKNKSTMLIRSISAKQYIGFDYDYMVFDNCESWEGTFFIDKTLPKQRLEIKTGDWNHEQEQK